MTDKAYIVTNERQERDVLEKFEREGLTWWGGDNLTENMPSKLWNTQFPYIIFTGKNTVTWNRLSKLEDEEIVFDGRKEEQMSEKYMVSQEFMKELEEWKQANFSDDFMIVNGDTIYDFSEVVNNWWYAPLSDQEQNNRLIAILRWVNGEDVFEVEKPQKWVVRSKNNDIGGDYRYVLLYDSFDLINSKVVVSQEDATKFDTKEEAESWANSHQEVVEVEE